MPATSNAERTRRIEMDILLRISNRYAPSAVPASKNAGAVAAMRSMVLPGASPENLKAVAVNAASTRETPSIIIALTTTRNLTVSRHRISPFASAADSRQAQLSNVATVSVMLRHQL